MIGISGNVPIFNFGENLRQMYVSNPVLDQTTVPKKIPQACMTCQSHKLIFTFLTGELQ